MKLFTLSFLAIALAAVASASSWPKTEFAGPATVVDGDTIDIDGLRVRLFGIDAPESDQACTDDVGLRYPCGTLATMALSGEIGGKPVTCRKEDSDRYGRTVATCWVGDRDIGAAMVRRGWAVDYTHFSHGRYAVEETAARTARRGLWRGNFERPREWRLEHRERRW